MLRRVFPLRSFLCPCQSTILYSFGSSVTVSAFSADLLFTLFSSRGNLSALVTELQFPSLSY